jgi:hypothetical protein
MTDTQFIYSFVMGWVSCWLWLKMMAEPPMIPTWGYVALRSKDKKTMVQVFTDLSTGLIVYTQVCQRAQNWHSWGPPTEVQRVD